MKISPFEHSFSRVGFNCGNAQLNEYFQKYISQDIRRRLCHGYVVWDEKDRQIAGFFTLSAVSLNQTFLPEQMRRGRYPQMPMVLIGRLAVSTNYQGQGIGSAIIEKAMQISETLPIGSCGLLVEPKYNSEAFYRKLQFVRILDANGKIFYLKFSKKK